MKAVNNRYFLYATAFFSGMSVMAVEMGASRLLTPYFSSSQVIWTVIIGIIISGIEIWQMDFFAGLFDSGNREFHEMIKLVYRYEALGAVPLGVNAAVLALLYGLGKTKLTLVLNFSRVFVFRIPVFWYLQNYTNYGEASVGIVMMVSNIASTVMAAIAAAFVIRNFKKEYIGDNDRQRSPEPKGILREKASL